MSFYDFLWILLVSAIPLNVSGLLRLGVMKGWYGARSCDALFLLILGCCCGGVWALISPLVHIDEDTAWVTTLSIFVAIVSGSIITIGIINYVQQGSRFKK